MENLMGDMHLCDMEMLNIRGKEICDAYSVQEPEIMPRQDLEARKGYTSIDAAHIAW